MKVNVNKSGVEAGKRYHDMTKTPQSVPYKSEPTAEPTKPGADAIALF